MKKEELARRIRYICQIYIDAADRMEGKLPKESWWEGYHTGQRKLAEHIVKRMNELGV